MANPVIQWLEGAVHIDHLQGTPVYLQIASAFIQGIRHGQLRSGARLPGSRDAARRLQVNRMTIVATYEELSAQGWIEKFPRKGTYVSVHLPELRAGKISQGASLRAPVERPAFPFREKDIPSATFSEFPVAGKLYFNDGFPDPRLAPVEELAKKIRSQVRLPGNRKYLMYGGAQGTDSIRRTLAEFLGDSRGLPVTLDNILVTRGAQMGIYLASTLILQPGDAVVVGEPGYTGANLTFLQLGATIHRVPVDHEGIDVNAIEQLCRQKKIRMVYVIPHHHNPTTVTLTPPRRIRLLELASTYRFAILEDDYDYDFHYASRPLMPIASLDNTGCVIYIGTLTKTLAPSIRIGFLVAPRAFVQSATHLRKSIDSQGDTLLENAIAEMYRDGSMSRHIKKSVKIYHERRDHFCALLTKHLGDAIRFHSPDGGMSVWVSFLSDDLAALSAKAAGRGLIFKDGREFDTIHHRYNALRIGFASLNFSEQQKAVAILGSLIRPRPPVIASRSRGRG